MSISRELLVFLIIKNVEIVFVVEVSGFGLKVQGTKDDFYSVQA